MNPMDKKTISLFVVFIVIALVIGFFFGQWQGKNQSTTEDTQKLQPLIDAVFPEPPSYIGNFTGIIKGISGATIALQINDLSDYLPHLDGSPRKTQTRFATVTPATKITSVDGPTGNTTTITLKDLKIGDAITVTSDQNIRNLEKFDVTEVRIVK